MEEVKYIMITKRKKLDSKLDRVDLQRNKSKIEARSKENNAFAFNIGSYAKNVETQCVFYDKKLEQGG